MNIIPQPISQANYGRGRGGQQIRAIVIHVSEGTLQSMTNWFKNAAAQVSAHYAVSRTGVVLQYVPDEDTAWHAGKVVRPSAPIVHELGGNPNRWSIGIEHEGHAHQEPTPAQIMASAQLLAHLSQKHGIPLDERHVIPHRAIRADKTCPGLIDVRELLLHARATGPVEVPRPGERRYSDALEEDVILTRFVSDTEWYFLRESELSKLGQRAGAPWSAFPESRSG